MRIEWQGHNPVIEMTVLDPLDVDTEVPQLAAVDVDDSKDVQSGMSSSSMPGFHRQARP